MRKVLVVSYRYPPYMSAGAIRISKFTKYLPEYGWMPLVLTSSSHLPAILTLESPAPVYRTRQISPIMALQRSFNERAAHSTGRGSVPSSIGRWCLKLVSALYHRAIIPDPQIGWYPFAVAEGRRIVTQERPEAIFSSALPATSHLVASKLARESGIPWVAEFRDPWTDHLVFKRPEPFRSLERVLERRVMRRAATLVTVSQPLADLLSRSLGRPVGVIPNGYDPADYPEYVAPSRHFTLTYTGMYYSRNHDALPLLEAIAELAREHVIVPGSFELRFVGSDANALQSSVQRLDIERFVRFVGVVSHEESVRAQMESSGLVFFPWIGRDSEGTVSSKIYEYLGSGRPILAVGPGNIATRLIESCRAGEIVRTAEQVAAVLRRWLQEFHECGTVRAVGDAENLKAFERRALTGQLAELLNQACAGSQ